jgi:hypothetical protein
VEGQAFFTGTLRRKRNKEQKLPQSRLFRVSDDGKSEKSRCTKYAQRLFSNQVIS